MNSKKCKFIFTILLVTLFNDISACGSRHGRGRHSSHHSSGGIGHFWRPSHHSGSYHSPSSSSHSSGSSHSSDFSHSNGVSSHDSHPFHSSSNAQPSHTSHDSHPSSVNHDSGSYRPIDYSPPVHVPVYPSIHINPFPAHHHRHHNVPASSNQPAGSYGNEGQNTAIQNQENDSNSSEEEFEIGTNFDSIEKEIQKMINSVAEEVKPNTTIEPMPEVDVPRLQLSCKKGLCKSTKNYPLKEVESAVQEMKTILFVNSLNSDAELNINSNVKDYFSTPKSTNYDINIINSTECQEDTKYVSPLGGYDINGTPFIIVNVASLTQEVKISKCSKPFNMCNTNIQNPSICQGFHKNQELLVLPAKQGSFHHTEFSIKTFKVPGGCQCDSMQGMLHSDLDNIMFGK